MIQETSLQAYEEIKEELGQRQKLVLNAIRELESANNRIISQYLRLPINSVTPRVKELREMKLVGVDRVDVDPVTQKNTIYWKSTQMKGGLKDGSKI